MLFANPENEGKMDENNFKGDSVLTRIKQKLEDKSLNNDWIVKTCSKYIQGTATMYFDLKKEGENWVFDEKDIIDLFNGAYVSKSSLA